MKLAAAFGDPQSSCKLEVDALLEQSRWPNVATGTRLPGSGDTPGRLRPLVVVRFEDWENVQWPLRADARMRIVTWSTDADEAWDVSSYIHGRLLASTGASTHRGYLFNGGVRRDVDPDFGVPISAFTITNKARAEILTSGPADTPTA